MPGGEVAGTVREVGDGVGQFTVGEPVVTLSLVQHSGSLTTPPFTEPVCFIVMADAIEASRRQVGRFRELFPEGNSRETQRLAGRRVRSDAG